MSHLVCIVSNMKTRLAGRKAALGLELTWTHCGTLHRVSLWPEVRFSSRVDSEWVTYEPDPSSDSFASAAVMVDQRRWAQYLEYMPRAERDFLETFKTGRLGALAVLTRCPALREELVGMPALTAFVAAHVKLRGTATARWEEIDAVFNRTGVYGLLEWLGLPATKLTRSLLGKVSEADVARRSLEPLRAIFWDAPHAHLLNRLESLSEQFLFRRTRALAA